LALFSSIALLIVRGVLGGWTRASCAVTWLADPVGGNGDCYQLVVATITAFVITCYRVETPIFLCCDHFMSSFRELKLLEIH
jgi:hypothetical protein